MQHTKSHPFNMLTAAARLVASTTQQKGNICFVCQAPSVSPSRSKHIGSIRQKKRQQLFKHTQDDKIQAVRDPHWL